MMPLIDKSDLQFGMKLLAKAMSKEDEIRYGEALDLISVLIKTEDDFSYFAKVIALDVAKGMHPWDIPYYVGHEEPVRPKEQICKLSIDIIVKAAAISFAEEIMRHKDGTPYSKEETVRKYMEGISSSSRGDLSSKEIAETLLRGIDYQLVLLGKKIPEKSLLKRIIGD